MSSTESERANAQLSRMIGPFRVLRVLGRGGMGVVYHGEHHETGLQAAVKTIAAAAPAVVSAIRCEIRALHRLRHPGIVGITGSGVHDGLPWYAMDLLDGFTLRDCLIPAAHGSGPRTIAAGTLAALSQASGAVEVCSGAPHVVRSGARRAHPNVLARESPLAVIAETCQALSYLHENGIVHRDLKPENIFIQADGPPVLVDFGISTEFAGSRGREELDSAWSVRLGTLAYMAPEQIRGEPVDARADLYAVGCILYECVTGQRVFPSTDSHALREAHLSALPIAPSKLVSGVPEELDRLILQLLEKDPENRLGYADDVARILTGLNPTSRFDRLPVLATYLYRPRFVGRTQVLERLQNAIRALDRDGVGGIWLLSGESGVGKTRIANESVLEATRCRLNVALGQCSSIAVGAEARSSDAPLHAFAPLLLAIADECQRSCSGEIERLLGAHGRLLSVYQPALLEVPGFADLPEPERGDGPEARQRVLAAAQRAILNFAALRPVLLIIDDLQWADELSLALLGMLAQQDAADSRLLIFGTHRAEETSPPLRQLLNLAPVRHIPLERFGASEVRAMVQGMLALPQAEEPLVEYLASHSNGNPFFIVEHLRTAIAEGLLVRDGRGRWQLTGNWRFDEAAALPEALADLIRRRLLHLGVAAKRLVEAASVLGRQFDVDLLHALAAVDAKADSDAWSLLHEKQILEECEPGRLRFVHDGLREAAYSQLSTADLEGLHAQAAIAIEATYSEHAREPYYADLAHHYSKSHAPECAARYFRLAGERAQRAFATSAAVGYFQQALREYGVLGGPARCETRAAIQEALTDLLLFDGDAPGAQLNIQAAIDAIDASGSVLRARRLRKLARVMERQHRHAEALEVYHTAERALGALPTADDEGISEYWQEFVQIQVDAAWNLYFMARVDELDALVTRVQSTVEQHGNPAQRSRFFTSIAQSLVKRARLRVSEHALRVTERALAVGEKSTDPRERAVAHFARAFPLTLYGDYATAESLFVQAVAGAERVGDTALLTRVLAYYGVLLRRSEQATEARAVSERSLALACRMNMADYAGVSHANLAWVADRDGNAPACEHQAESALAAWAKLPTSYIFPIQWLARLPYARCLSARGRQDLAVDQLRFLLRDEQMALDDDLVMEIQRETLAFEERGSSSLDLVWSLCRSRNYL